METVAQEAERKGKKSGQVSGFIALVGAAFVVGGLVTFSYGTPTLKPSVDPYAAYCRGYSDGVAKVLMDQGDIMPVNYEQGAPVLDAECLIDVKSETPVFTAELRGPLLPEVPE